MPYDQLPEFVKRLRASDNMAALALEFLILTATRTSETLGMQWERSTAIAAVWVVPEPAHEDRRRVLGPAV